MPSSTMPFEEFQQKRHRIMQEQVSKGLAAYVLRYGLSGMGGYIAGLIIYRLLRQRPILSGNLIDACLSYAIPALACSIFVPLLNFYSIKKQLKKA